MEVAPPKILFPARTQYLEVIRSFCREVLGSHTDEQLHRKLILAIDEAVANVIEHAYSAEGGANGSSIELSIEVLPDRIVAQILDHGRPFDPRPSAGASGSGSGSATRRARGQAGGQAAGQPGKPVYRFPQRGFGLQLIRLIMDEIDYRRTADGENVLVLTKHLKKG